MTFSEKSSIGGHSSEEEDWFLAIMVHYIKGLREGHMANETIDFAVPILKPVVKHTYPIFIIQYALLAIFAVLSNLAVLAYILRLRLFYDSTHAFIINLALCHIVQCTITLPLTLMVLLVQNWLWGQFLCFFLPFLQDIPLHASMITHLLIAWDRMRWLSDPLKGRIPAFVCSCATWLAGMVIALPYPIYTAYVDLGTYQKEFAGVGICVYNLIDDMQEYSRGLFIMMYCLPATMLAYLYIRTSRDLKAPEGALGVMMFEVRSSIRHKRSASATMARANREELSKAYDLFDAELDISKDKRAQRHLGAMASAHVICICPLMVLKLAKMVLVETYANTNHFDLTYLMFVWIAFLPTAINPWIYASLVLPSHIRKRFLNYLSLSGKRGSQKMVPETRSSIEEESSVMLSNPSSILNPPRIVSTMEADYSKYQKISTRSRGSRRSQHSKVGAISEEKRLQIADQTDSLSINNSCSNITASTYCINGGTERESAHFEGSPYAPTTAYNGDVKRASLTVSIDATNGNTPRGSFRKKLPQIPQTHLMEKRGSYASTHSSQSNRKGSSSSTLDRDHEIIDMLERERSMDFVESAVFDRQPSYRSRKLPRSPAAITEVADPEAGYAGDLSTCSGSSVRRSKFVANPRRPSYEDPLNVVDRKIYRTVSNEPPPPARSDVISTIKPPSERLRRHSTEKHLLYGGAGGTVTDF